jgi:pentatricopeptide repeat protein
MTLSVITKCNGKRALACVKELRRVGVEPTAVVYNAAIARCKTADELRNCLADMREHGVKAEAPNSLACEEFKRGEIGPDNLLRLTTTRIGSCDWELTSSCMAELRRFKVKANAITYSAAFVACKSLADLQDCLLQMKHDHVKPDSAICSNALLVLLRLRLADEALDLFDTMVQQGLEPDIQAYGIAFSACPMADRGDRALGYLAQMKASNLKPNADIYGHTISMCVSKGLNRQAQQYLEEAIVAGVYKSTLGYDEDNNELNFHVHAVQFERVEQNREPAVPASVAKAIFRHHHTRGSINGQTEFVVGYRGINAVRAAIEECIRESGGTPAQSRNPGCISFAENSFVDAVPQARRAGNATKTTNASSTATTTAATGTTAVGTVVSSELDEVLTTSFEGLLTSQDIAAIGSSLQMPLDEGFSVQTHAQTLAWTPEKTVQALAATLMTRALERFNEPLTLGNCDTNKMQRLIQETLHCTAEEAQAFSNAELRQVLSS